MIRIPHTLRAFEDDLARRTPPDHLGNLRLVEAMLVMARQLGVWPPADPLEGIDVDRLPDVLAVTAACGFEVLVDPEPFVRETMVLPCPAGGPLVPDEGVVANDTDRDIAKLSGRAVQYRLIPRDARDRGDQIHANRRIAQLDDPVRRGEIVRRNVERSESELLESCQRAPGVLRGGRT